MEKFIHFESKEKNREIVKQLQGYLDNGYLLHGSKSRNEALEPRQSNDTDPERVAGKSHAVYAEGNDIRVPIFMALQQGNNAEVGYTGFGQKDPFYVYGDKLTFSTGYIHVLPPDTFEFEHGKNEREIISRVPVVPIQIIEIQPSILDVLENFHVVSKEERDAEKLKRESN